MSRSLLGEEINCLELQKVNFEMSVYSFRRLDWNGCSLVLTLMENKE